MYEEKEDSLERLSFGIWKKIFKLVFKRKVDAIIIMTYMIILAALDIFTPYLSSKALDVFFGDNPRYDLMWPFIGVYIVIALLYMVIIYAFIRKAGKVEAEVSRDIRKEAYDHLQELSLSYYDRNASGWIMARLTSDSRKLAEIISWGIVDISWGIATMSGVLIILYVVYAPLALIITVLTPILLGVCLLFRRRILMAYRDVRNTNSKITGAFNEGILGSKTTKTLVLEGKKVKEFNELSSDMRKKSIRAIIRSAVLWPTVLVIGYIGVGLTLGIGSAFNLGLIGTVALSFSTLYLFINYTTLFFDPVIQITSVIADLQQAQASAERIIGLIETKSDIVDRDDVTQKYGTFASPKRENWEPLVGDIDFNSVSFHYKEKDNVLTDFNLHIKAGTSVALVGHTGSGKSTIVNLLCRFYEPTDGSIYIDGKDYRDRSVGWLHENIGYVLQTPYLFNASIKDNVKYGKLDATDEEVERACKIVNASEFIEKLDKGYDTMVGENGAKLSVGERQLISFARAIINDPKILVLDEATSSIDTQTEVIIKEATNKLLEGRTSFIVAHRLSTIINSDLILVIDGGKIVESGTHKELLQKNGKYFELYKNQFINEFMEDRF